MTPLDLDELERLEAAATPGPWEYTQDGNVWAVRRRVDGTRQKIPGTRNNQDMIIALRNAFPALLRELRARRRQVEIANDRLLHIWETGTCEACDSTKSAIDELAEHEPAAPAKGGEGEHA